MKKLVTLLLALVMVLSLVACGGTTTSSQATPAESQAAPVESAGDAGASEAGTDTPALAGEVKVAALLPGTINDNGWNAGAYQGLTYLESTYDTEIAYTENVANSDVEEHLRGYADDGFGIIVAHGTQYIDAVKKVAPEYEDVYFYISNADVDNSQEPNVACFGTVYTGFMAGAVAAAVSETGTVAVLGGEQSPSITPIVDLFIEGAKYVNPDIDVQSAYIGSLTDADKAKEMTLNFINNNGADVVCASANSAGLGTIQAASEAGVYAIGFNSDQYDAAPDAVIVSVLRNFEVMFDTMYKDVTGGTFEPKVYAFGIAEDGTILSDWHGWDQELPAEALEKIDQVIQDFKDGTITMNLSYIS